MGHFGQMARCDLLFIVEHYNIAKSCPDVHITNLNAKQCPTIVPSPIDGRSFYMPFT
jgi:hypothetical protein